MVWNLPDKLLLAVTTIVSVPYLYMQLIEVDFGSTSSIATAVFIGVLASGIVYVLWQFPLTIAGKLLTPSAQEPDEFENYTGGLDMQAAVNRPATIKAGSSGFLVTA